MERSLSLGLSVILTFLLPSKTEASDRDTTQILFPTSGLPVRANEELNNLLQFDSGESAADLIEPIQHLADTVLEKRKHAHALLERVLTGQLFLESLDALSEIELPVGVVKAGGSLDYSILIDRILFTKEGALMDAYVSLALPQTGTRIAFHGNIPLSADGGVSGNAKVYLLGDHMIKLSSTTSITIRGTEASYVEFDCKGFLGVNLDAEMQFSKDLITPEDENGQALDERLRVSFTTYTQSLHDIIVTLSLPPFQIKGLSGFGFHVQQAQLDWSDLANPANMVFPADYSSPVIDAGIPNLWQGIYIQEIEIRLPPAFATGLAGGRISVGAERMILDDQGVTGNVYAENLLQDGNMNGWSYSVDRFALNLFTNRVSGFSIEGLLSIPVVKAKDGENTTFNYVAQRSAAGEYIFSVTVHDELKLDLWVADLKLASGSSVIVIEKNGKFYPSAHLNGELSILISEKGPQVRLNSIRFENMVIDSEAPYFRPGTFGFGREDHNSTISKYPVVFDNITIKSEKTKVGIAFDLILNISGKPEDESFGGKAGLVVWGVQDNAPARDDAGNVIGIDRFSWKFDKVELSSVKINIKKPKVIELAGELRFYDEDAIYGEGFKGLVRGTINNIKVEAQALFGKTETFRYWYADALVELNTGIPIVPGVLSAFGFGGGYYSKMKQSEGAVEGTLGRAPSGITYVPDYNTIGIRAIVLIGTTRPEAMKGDVALEVSLNRHGGINSVTFTGNANFMSAASLGSDQIKQLASAAVAGRLTEKLSSLTRGQVYGSVKLHFDNLNDVFHGNLEIYVNVAGGIVRGVSEGNKAGWAVMHFEKNDWYIHIGTPDQPLGLEVARIFKSKSYFMLGKNLPGSPPPPPQVSEILGDVNLDYMRDLNALESGMGIAFGLHFLVDTGDLRFLMFYGRFSAGTGLDFMLKDYGNEYHCAGSSGPMGIDGWYANGQAYAFVMGKIGVKVNLRFYKGTYDILSIGAAAIMQAKGPNPFWMKGTVGGYYKILGGLVNGKCRFEVTIGKECKPVREQNLLEEIDLIAGISPVNLSTDVNVFNTPQVTFNVPVGRTFEITDIEAKTHHFRAVLDEFIVLDDSRRIVGDLKWNTERDVVVFDANDLLPGQKKLKARAKLTFEEKVQGQWTKVKFGGKVVAESAESEFETGEAPDFIPATNVLYAYPLPDHNHFYPQEYDQGYIQLREGQPYLFNPGREWLQRVRVTEMATGQFFDSDVAYEARARQIRFAIPPGLQNSKEYLLQIVNIPQSISAVDANVRHVETQLTVDPQGGTAWLNTQSAEQNLNIFQAQSIYKATFRTSSFNTFSAKMKSINFGGAIRISAGINIFQLASYLKGGENFDAAELSPLPVTGSLIQAEAIIEGNSWYEDYVHPLIYEGYPLFGWMKVRRQHPERLGIPPIRDIYFENIRESLLPSEIAASSPGFVNEYVVYNLGPSVASDFFDMQRHAVNFAVDHPTVNNSRVSALILKPLPYLRYGRYKIRFSYSLPGINKITSSYEAEVFNRIPDSE